MITKGLIFYIGCALLPSPPSPCYDFGLQFIIAVGIAVFLPEFFMRPINNFLIYSGRFFKKHLGKKRGIGFVVMKIDKALKLWERGVDRLTNPKNKYLRAVTKIIVRRNFVQRLIVGYFLTILLGIVLMIVAVVM